MVSDASGNAVVTRVRSADFAALLPLVRSYCDFYDVAPPDDALLALFEALVRDPIGEGVQVIARASDRRPVGFATVYWSWSTARAARIGVMNDLFVAVAARGTGVAEQLIQASLEECRQRGATALGWQTAPENRRAQRVYDRVGATREQWIDYVLDVPSQPSS